MLKIDKQEDLIMIFFVITLLFLGIYVIVDKNIIDIIYLVVLLYYFIKFLIIKNGD